MNGHILIKNEENCRLFESHLMAKEDYDVLYLRFRNLIDITFTLKEKLISA